MFFLENEIIGLRNLELSDLNGGYKDWFNDASVCFGNGHHKFPMTNGELVAFIENIGKTQSEIVLAVVEKNDDKHIGNVALQRIDMLNKNAKISLIFGEKEYWNKGYASMAVGLLMKHAFEELGLNKLSFGTLENNTGMQKLGEKLGFIRIGVFREELYKNGRYMDMYLYEILKREWCDLQKNKR